MADTPRILLLLQADESAVLTQRLRSLAQFTEVGPAELEAALADDGWDALLVAMPLAMPMLGRAGLPPLILLVDDSVEPEAVQDLIAAGAFGVLRRNHLAHLQTLLARLPRQVSTVHRCEWQYVRQLTENIQEVFWLLDTAHWRMVYISPNYEALWERPAELLMGDPHSLLDTVHPDDYADVLASLEEGSWTNFNLDYRIVLSDGSHRWIATRSVPIRDVRGRVYRVAGVSRDITEEKLHEEEARTMARALEQTADAVLITDQEGVIEYVNPAFEEITGYGSEEVIGQTPRFLKSGLQDSEFYRTCWQNLLNGLPFSDIFINRRKDGELYYEAKTITPVRDDNGQIRHYVSTAKDITRRLKAHEQQMRFVHYDAVTGLANRLLLDDRLNRAILQAKRLGRMIGVLFIDLGLGRLLEGNEIGDREQLLRAVAQRFQESCGEGDTVALLEQERFVMLHKLADETVEIENIARKLVAAFAEPVSAAGYELFLTPYIGISCYPDDGERGELLIQHAEQAMELAHHNDGELFCFYHHTGSRKASRLSG